MLTLSRQWKKLTRATSTHHYRLVTYPEFRYLVWTITVNNWDLYQTLREMCPYSQLFWSACSRIMERYSASLCIQSECGKIRTRITPITATFHAMKMSFIVLISSRTVKIAKKLYSSFYI